MESIDPTGQLLELERAEAAPYVHMRPSPWWYPPVAGLWAASLCAIVVWDLPSPWLLALVALELAFLAWMVRRQGAWPRLSGPKPPEIDRVYWQFLGGLGMLVVPVGLAAWLSGPAATVAIVFLGVTAGLAIYERAYESAAARARGRLAMPPRAS